MSVLAWLFNSPHFSFWATLLLLILNILDAHSTWLVIRPFYFHRERNPIARYVFRKMGIPSGIIVFKAVLMSILILCISYYAAWDAFTINIVLVVANIVFGWVVIHNYRVFLKYRR